jgi:DNA replication and repair protein RecF
MRLETLHLLNFKNYGDAKVTFSPRINVLVGKNGSGKTNLLDAIYFLSATKSAFSATDLQCIRIDQPSLIVRGAFYKGTSADEVTSAVQAGSRKVFRVGQYEYQKLSEHVGKYPVVLIAPDDVELVRDGSEARRRFFDALISQMDGQYLDDLIQYNHALRQRNGLLKMAAERGDVDWIAIESYDQQLEKFGIPVFEKRKHFVNTFLPTFNRYYQFIVNQGEDTSLRYTTALDEQRFPAGLMAARSKDIALMRTNFGVHRDDYTFTMAGRDMKRMGSQGQQKSFVIALKLAQFEILREHNGFKPILLLDDIFDKLDDFRIGRLLDLMKHELGQLFITDARPDRTRTLLDQIHADAWFFTIENGTISNHHEQP